MLFNSYVFLLAFLPLTWLCYFGLNKLGWFELGKVSLIAASFLFYGYGDPKLCLLLAGSILGNYFFHCILVRDGEGRTWRKTIMILAVSANFLLLFYFKYLDFTIRNINFLTGSEIGLKHVILPLGISFYTFQQVSFVIDSYHRQMSRYLFIDYALFVSFFPQLVAGPIVLHQEMIPQFAVPEKKKVCFGNITAGLEYLIWGLAKKVILADAFGRFSDVGFGAVRNLSSLSAVAVMLSYTLEIYFDFSGYCDMAIGLGKLFNIEIPMNFNSPYKAVNISQFWKRWHITLTRFLTTYLYIPLGGSRVKTWKLYRNIMIVFTLSGLWHGADWTFVVWGMMHGVMMVLYRMKKEKFDKLPSFVGWLITFLFVNVAWLFFRVDNFLEPLKLIYMMIFGGSGGFGKELTEVFCEKDTLLVLLGHFLTEEVLKVLSQLVTTLWFAGALLICTLCPSTHEMIAKKNRNILYFVWLALLFTASILQLSQVSKFIYFNF